VNPIQLESHDAPLVIDPATGIIGRLAWTENLIFSYYRWRRSNGSRQGYQVRETKRLGL
jgi:hypothetical protein